MLALGGPELRVLEGLLANAARHMPMAGRAGYETGEYMSTARTVRDMLKEVGKAVESIEEDGKSEKTTSRD